MVKKAKKLAKKKPEARGRAKKQTRKQVEHALSGPIRRKPAPPRRPKTTPLPGMEDMSRLSKAMLNIMDSMADQMHVINTAKATLKGLDNNAMNQMKRDNVTIAKAHGIELVRVPGEEKLRKRLLGDGSGSSDEGEGTTDEVQSEVDSLDNGDADALDELNGAESLADA